MDIVELCKKYRQEGVVAIDLAGDESLNCEAYSEHRDAYEVSAKNRPSHYDGRRHVCCYITPHALVTTCPPALTVGTITWVSRT